MAHGASRVRCPAYLDFVRSLPCCACGAVSDETQAHHIKGRGQMSGVGLKAGDQWAMPMCPRCHAELHSNPTPDTLDRQWEWVAFTLAAFIAAAADETPNPLVLMCRLAANRWGG